MSFIGSALCRSCLLVRKKHGCVTMIHSANMGANYFIFSDRIIKHSNLQYQTFDWLHHSCTSCSEIESVNHSPAL
jgi:hypothetical protein